MTEVLTYEALKADRDALERQLLMSEAKCKGYFSDAAAALIKCDALAVENAAKNDILNWNLETGMSASARAFHVGCDAKGCLHDAVQAMLIHFHTPATDAALAAIRLEAKIEGANELAERIAEMHSKTAPGSNIEKKLMFAAEAAIAYANGLREAK